MGLIWFNSTEKHVSNRTVIPYRKSPKKPVSPENAWKPSPLFSPIQLSKSVQVSNSLSVIPLKSEVLSDLGIITQSYWRLRANVASDTLLSGVLGHFQTIIQLMSASQILNPSAIRRQSTLFTDLAKTYIQENEIEKACKLAMQALTLTTQTHSLSVLQRIRGICDELDRWKETQHVKELNNQFITTLKIITYRESI